MIPAHEAPLAIRRVSFRPGRAICHLVKSSINEDGHRGRSLERVGSFAARPRVWLAPGMALSPALRLPYALTSRIYGTLYFSHQALVTSGHSPGASLFSAEFSGLAPIQKPRSNLPVECECTPVCSGCQDPIPIYCTNNLGSPGR